MMEVVIWLAPCKLERFLFGAWRKAQKKVYAISPTPSKFNPVRQHILSTARPCFSCVWQVAKVEIREVVRQIPKVEVSRQRRHVNDTSLPSAISLPFWPWILQVKYVEKKVPKQVIQYASRLGDICASTFPPAKVCQKYEIT